MKKKNLRCNNNIISPVLPPKDPNVLPTPLRAGPAAEAARLKLSVAFAVAVDKGLDFATSLAN